MCVREKTHIGWGGLEGLGGVQNPIDFTLVLNPNAAVFYICVFVCVASYEGHLYMQYLLTHYKRPSEADHHLSVLKILEI